MAPTIGAHPTRLDLLTHPGEPVDFTVPILDADNLPVADLTGWTAAAEIRASASPDAAQLYTFDVTVGDGVRVVAAAVDTLDWAFSTAPWDLVVAPPGGGLRPLVGGWVRHYPTITRIAVPDPGGDSDNLFHSAFAATF